MQPGLGKRVKYRKNISQNESNKNRHTHKKIDRHTLPLNNTQGTVQNILHAFSKLAKWYNFHYWICDRTKAVPSIIY